ncbi:LapA family protein [Pseudomonas aeruginosa]|uniref:LapA family protein n=1 Tax=Pseudomonas aeruginosa TaxID=287 RepID=UPI001F245BA8|nr:LapA family protein [Pseudomonas aeruginosa]
MVQAICRCSGFASGIYRGRDFRAGKPRGGPVGLPRNPVSSMALAVYIIIAFILGGALGLAVQLPFLAMSRVRASSLRAELVQARKEVDTLRAEPSKVS